MSRRMKWISGVLVVVLVIGVLVMFRGQEIAIVGGGGLLANVSVVLV